jgi:hypothetical protein
MSEKHTKKNSESKESSVLRECQDIFFDIVQQDKKMQLSGSNVYSLLRKRINDKYQDLKDLYQSMDDDEEKRTFLFGNKGVKFYTHPNTLFKHTNLQDVVSGLEQFETKISFIESVHSFLFDQKALKDSDLVALFCDSDPIAHVYSGSPSALTDICLESNLLWKMHAKQMYINDEHIDLRYHTMQMFPDCDFQDSQLSILLQSSGLSTLHYFQNMNSEIEWLGFIVSSVRNTFLCALRQNMNRKKLGLPIYTRLVFGDLCYDTLSTNLHNLYLKTVSRWARALPYFQEIVIAKSSDSLNSYIRNQSWM